MDTTPQRLGQYELQKLLGGGSLGEVWQGYDFQARSDVAIKLLHPDLQADPNFMTRFMQEGKAISALHHSNLVQVREVNIYRDPVSGGTTPYIVMDYVEGQNVAHFIQTTSRLGNFPAVSAIVYLFTSLGLAIDHAHDNGIIHGNLKPANILLNKHNTLNVEMGEPMLADIGVANLLENNAGSAFNAQFIASSSFYLSPEQAKGLAAHASSDIYALGVILYEICTGILPFHDESLVAVMLHHINTLPTPPSLINPNIPPALSEVILRAMAKDPAARFPAASSLAAALADACSVNLSLNKPSREPGGYIASEPQRYPSPQATGNLPILGVSQPLSRISSQMPTVPARESSPLLRESLQDSRTYPAARSTPVPSAVTSSGALQKLPVTPSSLQPQADKAGHLSMQGVTASLPTPSAKMPISSLQLPTATRRGLSFSPLSVAIIVLLLLLVVVSALGASLLLRSAGKQAASVVQPGNNAAGHVFFLDDALGHDDMLRVEMQNIALPPAGKRYYAWIESTAGQAMPLGPLTVQNGKATLLYMGDARHSNLLAVVQSVFVTLEDNAVATPLAPSMHAQVYSASFAGPSFQYIKNLLDSMPDSSSKSSLIVALFETIKGMNDKAGSIVDSVQVTHDYALAQRQAIRIIEMIDGSQYARSSGDLPAKLPSLLTVPVGLISSPTAPGYIDMVAAQVDKVKQTSGNNAVLLQHAQNVSNAIADLRDWIQKLRSYDVQILQSAALSDPGMINTALQLKQQAADAYTGRTIPPNAGPLPIPGSAGAYQAYVECQYMTTLDLVKVK